MLYEVCVVCEEMKAQILTSNFLSMSPRSHERDMMRDAKSKPQIRQVLVADTLHLVSESRANPRGGEWRLGDVAKFS